MAKHAKQREKPQKESPRKTAGRSIWSGTISFGLVNIPVKLFLAARNKDVHFHLLHEKDNARVQRRYICPVDEKEVPKEEIKKAPILEIEVIINKFLKLKLLGHRRASHS